MSEANLIDDQALNTHPIPVEQLEARIVSQGVSCSTARSWYRAGLLPVLVPALKRGCLVLVGAPAVPAAPRADRAGRAVAALGQDAPE